MESQQVEQQGTQNVSFKTYVPFFIFNIFVLVKDFLEAFLLKFVSFPLPSTFNPLPPVNESSFGFSLQNISLFNFESLKGFEYLDISKIYSLIIPLILIFIFYTLLSFLLIKKSIDTFLQKKIIVTVSLLCIYIYSFIYTNSVAILFDMISA